MLTLSKKDIMRINGKSFEPRNHNKSHQKHLKNDSNNKNFKHKKVTKGKKIKSQRRK